MHFKVILILYALPLQPEAQNMPLFHESALDRKLLKVYCHKNLLTRNAGAQMVSLIQAGLDCLIFPQSQNAVGSFRSLTSPCSKENIAGPGHCCWQRLSIVTELTV